MKKPIALLNLTSVALVIAVNYSSQALRLNGTTIGEISRKYDNLFTPASYAFAIWGIIFLSLVAYGIFQIHRAFFSSKESSFIEKTGYWFFIANVLNAAWVFAFVYDYTGLSVFIMLGILYALVKIILNTNMERWNAPLGIVVFVWWPISIYAGWIAVATIANIAAYLTKIGWNGSFFSPASWTVTMITIAVVLNLIVLWKRNLREFALVGAWALFAIYSRHKISYETIAFTALIGSGIIALCTVVHAFINKKTKALEKVLQRRSEN